MFFPEKIKNIKKEDKVLEIGPGGDPHPRANFFLDIKHLSDREKFSEFGSTISPNYKKPFYYYNDGEDFPFKDKEFDYVICSHVIEHTKNIPHFVKELVRISNKGYLEFPTPHYEYLYNFDVHKNFLYYNRIEKKVYWTSKNDKLKEFEKCNLLLKKTLEKGYTDFIDNNKEIFFSGFEWEKNICLKEVDNLLLISYDEISLIPKQTKLLVKIKKGVKRILKLLKIYA